MKTINNWKLANKTASKKFLLFSIMNLTLSFIITDLLSINFLVILVSLIILEIIFLIYQTEHMLSKLDHDDQ